MREKIPLICPDIDSCRHKVTRTTYTSYCKSDNVGGYIRWYNCPHLSPINRDKFIKTPKEWQSKEVADNI
jgi:hypothetical protein